MSFSATDFGNVALGSLLIDPGASDDTAPRPILTEINGVDARQYIQMDTLQIQDTLGQPVTASFTIVNGSPSVGDRIRIKFYDQVIFSGTIDHMSRQASDLTTRLYACDCLDWSQVLFRRKIRRNFTDMPVQNILDSLLDNELDGEGLTIGTIDTRATMPLVDAKSAKAFDICRDVAGATGQTFYVEFDKSLQMRSTTAPVAPLVLNEANVLMATTTNQADRETYRNVQTVIVTGTPVANEDALTTTQQRTNTDQIAARAAIEGGTGIYEEVEEITHPTSNDGAELALLGIGYARLRLATSGTPRQTIKCQVRGYGFRAGQIASVNLPTFGVVGTYIVQRVTIREAGGRDLFHDLELTTSSLQQRAYEAWLGIVKGGKVTVQMPGSVTNNLQTFINPGADTFTVPALVTTLELTCFGGSAGGSGSGSYGGGTFVLANGAVGAASGKTISIVTVTPGEILDLSVGAAGLGGIGIGDGSAPTPNVGQTLTYQGTVGTAAQHSWVKRGVDVLCQGNAGGQGVGGFVSVYRPDASHIIFTRIPGTSGSPGSGIGDAISIGGGKQGGTAGIGNVSDGSGGGVGTGGTGQDGRVEVRW